MTPCSRFRSRTPVLRVALRAACLAIAMLLACASHATARGASAAAAPDTARRESPPGRLIVPPPEPSGGSPATSAPALARPVATEDTARASRLRKARIDFGRGLMLEEQHAYAAAIVSYTNAARMDPALPGPSYRIGLLYASRQQYDPAARAFREELHRNPDDRAARMEYALALAELGDSTRPVRMLEELTRRAPGDAAIWRALGFVYGRRGRHADAERALRGAVGLEPRFARAWRDLGVVLAAQGRTGEAREAYGRAVTADPRDETALINLGNLESDAGDHARALRHYHEAERRDSSQAWAYRGQIRELVWLGRESDAGVVWRRWLGAAPHESEVREGAARHFVRQDRTDIALEIAREGVRLAPRSGEAWWLLGEMYARSPDVPAALGAYREAARRFRDTADRERAEAGIAALRAVAPDSLRALFAADSAAADSAQSRSR